MIEIKSADSTTHTPLDIDEVVAAQRASASRAPQAAPAPPPPPPPAEPATSQIPVIPQQATATYPVQPRQAPTPPSVPAMPNIPPAVAPTTPPASASGPQLDWAAIVEKTENNSANTDEQSEEIVREKYSPLEAMTPEARLVSDFLTSSFDISFSHDSYQSNWLDKIRSLFNVRPHGDDHLPVKDGSSPSF